RPANPVEVQVLSSASSGYGGIPSPARSAGPRSLRPTVRPSIELVAEIPRLARQDRVAAAPAQLTPRFHALAPVPPRTLVMRAVFLLGLPCHLQSPLARQISSSGVI